jgi:hypothetical protein
MAVKLEPLDEDGKARHEEQERPETKPLPAS